MTVQDTIETKRQKHLKDMVSNCAVCDLVGKEFVRLNGRIDELLTSVQEQRTLRQAAEDKVRPVGNTGRETLRRVLPLLDATKVMEPCDQFIALMWSAGYKLTHVD